MIPAILSKAPNLFPSYFKRSSSEIQVAGEHLVQPIAPRQLGTWDGEPLDQAQSRLLQLPAELRNVIYEYVFSNPEYPEVLGEQARSENEAKEKVRREQQRSMRLIASSRDLIVRSVQDSPARSNSNGKGKYSRKQDSAPHQTPLSSRPSQHLALLLTCRLVATEAAPLAFTLHTHELRTPHIHFLSASTSKLPTRLFASLRRLALCIDPDQHTQHLPHAASTANFVVGALLLSPRIAHVDLRVYTRSTSAVNSCANTGTLYAEYRLGNGVYVPRWFAQDVLGAVLNGRMYRWPKGECWRITWPVLNPHPRDLRGMVAGHEDVRAGWNQNCTALLVQEGGREVRVQLVFSDGSPGPKRFEEVILNPDIGERVVVEEVPRRRDEKPGPSGFMHTPGEEYWEELRKRKRKNDSWAFGSGIAKMMARS